MYACSVGVVVWQHVKVPISDVHTANSDMQTSNSYVQLRRKIRQIPTHIQQIPTCIHQIPTYTRKSPTHIPTRIQQVPKHNLFLRYTTHSYVHTTNSDIHVGEIQAYIRRTPTLFGSSVSGELAF